LPAPCGHYYPDVLRLRDERREGGTLIRVVDCLYCGRSEERLDPRQLAPALVRRLKKKGIDVSVEENELPQARERAFRRLRAGKKQDGKD
jgi:hypothetical protein